MKFEEIVDAIANSKTRTMDKGIVAGLLLYNASVALNQFGYRKNLMNRNKEISFYMLGFQRSGSGKDFMMRTIKNAVYSEERYIKRLNSIDSIYRAKMAIELDDFQIKMLPTSSELSLRGTGPAIEQRASRINNAGTMSMNIVSTEFITALSRDRETMENLIEYFEGNIKQKITKITADSPILNDIKGLPINFVGLSTIDSTPKDIQKILEEIDKKGLGRRSYVYNSKEFTQINYNPNPEKLQKVIEHFEKIDSKQSKKFIKLMQRSSFLYKQEFEVDSSFEKEMIELDRFLIKRAEEDRLDDRLQNDIGAIELIINMSILIAYIEGKQVCSAVHIAKAKELFLSSRKTVAEIFDEKQPFEIAFNILSTSKKYLTHAELIKASNALIPTGKKAFEECLLLLEEQCYYSHRELETLRVGGVTRYNVAPLKKTNVDEIHFGIVVGDYSEPSFLGWDNFHKLAKSNKINGFTLNTYSGNKKVTIKNFVKGSNLIGFSFFISDISIDYMKEILNVYKYLMYLEEEYENDDAKYNIIMPTSNHYKIERDSYHELMKNIVLNLGLELGSVDPETIDKIWSTNSEDVYQHNGSELFGISCCIPNVDLEIEDVGEV